LFRKVPPGSPGFFAQKSPERGDTIRITLSAYLNPKSIILIDYQPSTRILRGDAWLMVAKELIGV